MKKIIDFIKTHFLPIAGAIGILFSVVTWVYVRGYKASNKDSGDSIVVQNQVVMLDSMNSFSRQMQIVKVELGTISEKQTEAKNAYNSLRLVVLDMASKAPGMTIQQILEYSNSVPELKKNMLFNQIPYRRDTTPYSFTYLSTQLRNE